jgi:murein DD-endopeptidase MepM/ murein hydrolase activator NlpD
MLRAAVRGLLSLGASVLFAQTFTVTPQRIRQGEVLRVQSDDAESARMNKRTVRLFSQPDSPHLGLMPVPVLQKPGIYQLEFLNRDERVVHTAPITVVDAHYARQNITIERKIAALRPSQGEQESVADFRHEILDERYWKDRIGLPVPGCRTSPFGVQRWQNGKPTGDFHAGIDQRGAAGTPVRAITGGIVKLSRMFNLRGGTVAIDHGQGLESIYMHMSKLAAKEGNHIEEGTVIGYIGSTGRATGPHLHWTLYANGEPVNPDQWVRLPPPCGSGKANRTKK